MRNLSQFSVAHRSYGSLIVFATLSASFIGGGFSMGNAEKVFRFGIANIVALWGFSLKEILVARLIAPRMARFPGAISAGDVMATAYGKPGQVVTGLFSVVLCAGIVGAQVGAIGHITRVFLGISPIYGILVGCGIVIAYSTVGGMRAVVLTDVIQFDILIYSYNFLAPIILVPLAAVLMGLRATKTAFLAGTSAGVAGVLIWNYALRQAGGIAKA